MGNSAQALLRLGKRGLVCLFVMVVNRPFGREGAPDHPGKCGLAILCFCVGTAVLQAAESVEQNQDDNAHPDCQDREHNNKLLAIHTCVPSY